MLGCTPLNPKVHSKCYDQHMAEIRDGCTEENTFRVLIENYQDLDCYSTDMDQKIDELAAYRYAGTTVMCS